MFKSTELRRCIAKSAHFAVARLTKNENIVDNYIIIN